MACRPSNGTRRFEPIRRQQWILTSQSHCDAPRDRRLTPSHCRVSTVALSGLTNTTSYVSTPSCSAEDWWFVNAAGPLKLYRPSAEEAQAFSVETVGHPSPAGYHKPFNWHGDEFMAGVYARMDTAAKAVAAGIAYQ